MFAHLLESKGCVFKLAVGAKSVCALDLLEDWQQDGVVTASPEAFQSDHVERVNVVFGQKFLFNNELTSGE